MSFANSGKLTRRVLACGVSTLVLCISGAALQPAMAQAADASVDATSDAAEDRLGTIMVTSQRRAEDLQSTPLAITAATGEELKQQNVESLLDIGAIAPNVMVGSQSLVGANSGGFFIRGIGQDRSGIDFDQGVGLYVDGVFVSRSDNSFLNVVDVERIEILRGPQGTLFGKNTIGGAINYITTKPSDVFEGNIEGTVGSYDRTDIKGSINLPINDKLMVKATYGSLRRSGFLDHVIDSDSEGDMNTQVSRLQLRALPTDAVTIDLSASRTLSRNSGRAYIVDIIDPTAFAISRWIAQSGQTFDQSFLSPDAYTRYGGDNTSYKYDGYNLAGTVTVDISDSLQFKSISSYMEADVTSVNDWDGTNAVIYDTTDRRQLDQWSQEFQLTGTAFSDRLNYVTGVYYLEETPQTAQTLFAGFLGTFPNPRERAIDVEVKSYAAFAQGTYDLTDALSATVGVRYSKDEKTSASQQSAPAVMGGGTGEWDDVSPRFALEYQVSDDVMTYVSATKGFRSGGLNAVFSAASPFTDFDPETVWNYEAGFRSDLFDDRLRLNVTGFHMVYDNQQLTARDVATNTVFIQNVGEATRQGLEFEFQAAPTPQLRIQGTLGLLDASFEDVGTARDVTTESTVLRSPDVTYSIGGSYEFPLADGGAITPRLSYNYRSEQSTTSSDSNTRLLDGYGLLSGRLEYADPDDRWSIALYGTNLTDEEYFIGGFDFASRETFLGIGQLDVGRPREVGIVLDVAF